MVGAALFLAKLAIDNNVITPPVRVILLIVAGIAGLVWAEVSLRRAYNTTANAVSGASIATLYIAAFTAHSLYRLLAAGPTFAFMVVVTILAALIAIRYEAVFTAALGLLGGFATPLMISTGVDHPVGLFSYIFLLNLGLFAVIRRMERPGLAVLGLLGTLAVEVAWFGTYMSPPKLIVAMGAFLALALLYLSLSAAIGEGARVVRLVSGIGGGFPLIFACIWAWQPSYGADWPLLLGFVFVLDAAIVAVAVARDWAPLVACAAVGSGLILFGVAMSVPSGVMVGPVLASIAVAWLLNSPPRILRLLEKDVSSPVIYELAGVIAGVGLAMVAIALLGRPGGEPPVVFLLILLGLTGILLERGFGAIWPVGAFGAAVLAQIWFFASTHPTTLARNLAVPTFFPVLLSVLVALRGPRPSNERAEGGVILPALLNLLCLLAVVTEQGLGDPLPFHVATTVLVVTIISSAVRGDIPAAVLAALVPSALVVTVWQQSAFVRGDLGVALTFQVILYLLFLVLPFLVRAPRWNNRATPWAAAALAGPFFFFAIHQEIVASWGKRGIGLLPLWFAGVTVLALAGIHSRFPGENKAPGARRSRLALFAAVALTFVAVAIPLQLDNQWVTVGWALEAAAVSWLYTKLPHPGLKAFAAVLLFLVGVRLMVNPEITHYAVRGTPILNWLLYTYGVSAVASLLSARWLSEGEEEVGAQTVLPRLASVMGLLLIFTLINLEIVDYFSVGPYMEFRWERQMSRDLTMSLAWGVYGLALLLIGIIRSQRPLRLASLAFLFAAVLKVFLADLSTLVGLYRVLSFMGLGMALLLVSLLYQRFVFRGREA
jgi:uncharacterized membrane protein